MSEVYSTSDNNNSTLNNNTNNIDNLLKSRGNDVEGLHKLSSLLQTGLDRRMIACIIELIECGIDPDSISDCKLIYCMVCI